MATVLQKARLVVLSVAHRALDAVIDMNSVDAVKQNIRDLETSRASLSDSVASARGQAIGTKREILQLESKQNRLNAQCDSILGDNDPANDHYASTLEAELVGVEELLTLRREELVSAEETVKALDQTLSALTTRLTTMKSQLSRLEAMSRSAEAKEKAATAMRQAVQVSASGTGVSVDSVAARIQRRSDVADEKLKSAMGDFAQNTDHDMALAGVAARIAERKRRLARQTTAATAATP